MSWRKSIVSSLNLDWKERPRCESFFVVGGGELINTKKQQSIAIGTSGTKIYKRSCRVRSRCVSSEAQNDARGREIYFSKPQCYFWRTRQLCAYGNLFPLIKILQATTIQRKSHSNTTMIQPKWSGKRWIQWLCHQKATTIQGKNNQNRWLSM